MNLRVKLLNATIGRWSKNRTPLYWGNVGIPPELEKGVCHLCSGEDVMTRTVADFARKLAFAVEAEVTITRGPPVQPWMLRSGILRDRLKARVRTLLDAAILPVVGLSADSSVAQDDPDAWDSFVRSACRLLPTVTHWEVENEPDNYEYWPPHKYAQWLKIAAAAIRQINGGFIVAPNLGMGKQTPMSEFLPALDPRDYDVLSIHPYSGGIPYVEEALCLVPGKPVWIGETGATRWTNAAIRGAYHWYFQFPRVTAVFWYAMQAETDLEYNLVDRVLSGAPEVAAYRPRREYKTFKNIVLTQEI